MFDYGLSTLEQYDLTVKNTTRVRGAILCQTEEGLFILKEFRGSEKKIQKQQELLCTIQEGGGLADVFLENKEGNLVSRDKDNIPFTVQRWYEGRECDTKSREDIRKSIYTLANLHKMMKLPVIPDYVEQSLENEYGRHNQEIRKIRKFIRKKGASSPFEKEFLASVEWFLNRGQEALEQLQDSSYEEIRENALTEGHVCHGEYNQHNVLIMKNRTAVTNFGHWGFDVQMTDLYCFMRKILEKYNWDHELGREMLRAYHQEKRISPQEWENLRIRFLYPEKYWKIANYYYSHNKAWISEKNLEKLRKLVKQKEIWQQFVEKCFAEYPF